MRHEQISHSGPEMEIIIRNLLKLVNRDEEDYFRDTYLHSTIYQMASQLVVLKNHTTQQKTV